jgi:hypothetical protein
MIQSIVNSVKSNKFNEIMYAFHLLDKINYKRLAFRVRQTVDSPQIRMKVVLFEYDYTKLADINNGAQEGHLETIPGTRVHVQYVVHTDAFKELMQNMFCNMPGFTWFHRNRWENGKLNLNRRQKVLTAIAALVWIALLVAVALRSPAFAAVGGAGIAAIMLGNADLLRFFAKRHGWWFAAQTVPLQLLFHSISALGAAWAVLTVGFELLVGVLRGLDGQALLAALDPRSGTVAWSAALMLLTPLLAARLRGLR